MLVERFLAEVKKDSDLYYFLEDLKGWGNVFKFTKYYPVQGARSDFALLLGIPIQCEAEILVGLHLLGQVNS